MSWEFENKHAKAEHYPVRCPVCFQLQSREHVESTSVKKFGSGWSLIEATFTCSGCGTRLELKIDNYAQVWETKYLRKNKEAGPAEAENGEKGKTRDKTAMPGKDGLPPAPGSSASPRASFRARGAAHNGGEKMPYEEKTKSGFLQKDFLMRLRDPGTGLTFSWIECPICGGPQYTTDMDYSDSYESEDGYVTKVEDYFCHWCGKRFSAEYSNEICRQLELDDEEDEACGRDEDGQAEEDESDGRGAE